MKTLSEQVLEMLPVVEAEIDFGGVKKAAHDAAKDIFDGDYDEKKTNALIDGMIKKIKDGEITAKDTEDAVQIVINAMRGD